jgi:hypothetical protein
MKERYWVKPRLPKLQKYQQQAKKWSEMQDRNMKKLAKISRKTLILILIPKMMQKNVKV